MSAGLGTAELLARYDQPGPRYTSYPTAVEFTPEFGEEAYRERLAAADAAGEEPISLYAHLPFCEARCLFCGCNVVISTRRDVTGSYLDHLCAEIDLLARHLPRRRRLSQMHWGGGTPTAYPIEDLERLFGVIRERFVILPDAELGIEVDPRVTSEEQIHRLGALGFNRLSMGVQDFAPEVQQAVHRIQSVEQTEALIVRARGDGYRSVNLDLIFGLPYQTLEGFRSTLDQVITLSPDRIAVYSFAYVPWIQAHMAKLPAESLPDAALKLELLALAIDRLAAAGYVAIGMDHFAKPDDELARAQARRTLHRNFMGYTVQSATDLFGVGISAIGDAQGAYAQNTKKLPEHAAAVSAGRFPIARGRRLDDDDLVRRYVILQLMCNFHLDTAEVERRFGVDFHARFAGEIERLTGADSPSAHGLVSVTDDAIEVTPLGRLFVRNVAMIFDRYLAGRLASEKPVFSRTV
ncbi:MAG TPA: oxygen-independent coproporphyrinogen III oxidase [Candidatus Udaeobacter sp.]|jgi:oxygen-independent coproporphyrinogen-3 oxidase|nr:oxygen-independent coproporphyrinogen III oxidase [Candidatus Udaeobacter sp.]